MRLKKDNKLTKEGWVSDDSHHIWSDLGYFLAKDLNCDVWLNDMGFMELSTDEWKVNISIKWGSLGNGEVYVFSPTKMKSLSCGNCTKDRIGKENISSKIKDLLNLPPWK